MKQFVSIYLGVFILAFCSPLMAAITVSSPSASSSIIACQDYVLRYTATGGFSTYVVVEVHQNNSSGTIVKTYSNVSSGYLSANYDNWVSSSPLPAGNYQIKIYDYYNPSFNGWSDIFTISELSPPPSITIVSGQTTPTGFELMWTNPTGALEYRIDVSTTSDFTNIVSAYNDYHASGSASGGFYVSGLTAGQDRYVRIRSYNSCSTSGNSSTVNVPCFIPTTPTATAATNVRTCQFTANWNAVAGADRYTLIITRTGYTPETISLIFSTSYTYTTAHPSSNYSYKVKALSCGTSGESSSISLNTTALAVPNTDTFSGGGDGEEQWVSWGAIDGASSYRFQLDTDPNFGSPDINNIVYGTTKEFTVVPCLNYYIRLKAIAVTGEESAYCPSFSLGLGCRMMAADVLKPEIIAKDDPISDEEITPFIFFPNPSDNYLIVTLPKDFSVNRLNVRTIDARGSFIEVPFEFSESKAKFDVTGLSSGVYFVTITDGITKHRSKFVRK